MTRPATPTGRPGRWPRPPRRPSRRSPSVLDRRMPAAARGWHRQSVWIRAVDRESEGEPDPPVHAGGGERVGGAGGVGAGQQPRARPGTADRSRRGRACSGSAAKARSSTVDVVGGGVGARVPGPQQTGQRLPAGHLGTVQEAQQRVEPERLLPGRRSVLLLAVRDRDRGVEVQHTARVSRSGPAPAAHAAARATARAARTAARWPAIDPVQHPPRRRHRRHRSVQVLAIAKHADPADRVRAVGDRDREIGRTPDPAHAATGPRYVSASAAGHGVDQAGVLRHLPQQTRPRHATPRPHRPRTPRPDEPACYASPEKCPSAR